MRYVWGGVSLMAFVVGVGGLLLAISNSDYNNQIFGGVAAFVGLLVAYVTYRLGRRYR